MYIYELIECLRSFPQTARLEFDDATIHISYDGREHTFDLDDGDDVEEMLTWKVEV